MIEEEEMKGHSNTAKRSRLRLFTIWLSVGLLLLLLSFDYFEIRISSIKAHSNGSKMKRYENKSVGQTDYFNHFSDDLKLEQMEAKTRIDSVGFYKTAPGEIVFNFSGYGNPQRPFPGYQGRFQLGPVWISGGGVIRAKDGKLLRGGYISHRDDLLAGRSRNHRTKWRVVRGLGVDSENGVTVLKLLVRITTSNYPRICPVGTQGVLSLTNDNSRMKNQQTRDSIQTQMPNPSSTAPDGGAACRTHTHGMNNVSYNWTDPPRGGPRGGNRADVNIKVEAANVGICNVAGRWRQTTRGVGTSIWTLTHLEENRYRATEQGSGNATGTAVLTGNKLRLDASVGNLKGYYLWTITPNCKGGSGILVFTGGRRGTYTSAVTLLPGGGGGTSPAGRYRRYANTGINASFDVNYFYRNVTVKQCSAECNKYTWCRGFEYIPSRKHCYLHRTSTRKGKRGVEAYIKN